GAADEAIVERVVVGEDRGDAGAHRAAAGDEAALAAVQRHVADAHALDVGDRVVAPRLEAADAEAELAQTLARLAALLWASCPHAPLPAAAAGSACGPGADAGLPCVSACFLRRVSRRRASEPARISETSE